MRSWHYSSNLPLSTFIIGISNLAIKLAGKLQQVALVGVTIFSVKECVWWETSYWFLTLGGEAGGVSGNPSPMGYADTLGGDAGVNLGEGAGFRKM